MGKKIYWRLHVFFWQALLELASNKKNGWMSFESIYTPTPPIKSDTYGGVGKIKGM